MPTHTIYEIYNTINVSECSLRTARKIGLSEKVYLFLDATAYPIEANSKGFRTFVAGERLNLGIYNHIYEKIRMATKKQTLLYIDAAVTEKANDLGLNLSKVSENA